MSKKSHLAEMLPSFVDEMAKEAGLKDLAKRLPGLAKKIPKAGKAAMDHANLAAAKLHGKFPSVYRELNDPTNYPGPLSALKKIIGD